jgi:arabinose-5-phosphate isomerase
MRNDLVEYAKRIFDTEIQALTLVRDSLGNSFSDVIDEIAACKGRVILTGIGKSGHIAGKIAATLASLGTPAFFLHPAEAVHGDLGMVTKNDAVIMISYSGESDELIRLIPAIKLIGASLISISGNPNSSIVKNSKYAILFPSFKEACFMDLAPTSSTTVALVTGDALAVTAAFKYGFTERNYSIFHPSGALGKKMLLKVSDIMASRDQCAIVTKQSSLIDSIVKISKYKHGLVVIEDSYNKVAGVFSDGDLRRLFEKRVDVYDVRINDVMITNPVCVNSETLAAEALNILRESKIFAAPVLDAEERLCGIVTLQDILMSGVGIL